MLTGALAQAFAHRPLRRRQLPRGGPRQAPPGASLRAPAQEEESGAVIAAIGGRIAPTADFLADLLNVDDALEDADLLVVVEPELASPLLATSTLDALTRAAGELALPVVAATVRSSLAPLRTSADGACTATLETEASVTLDDVGRRIARTWLR